VVIFKSKFKKHAKFNIKISLNPEADFSEYHFKRNFSIKIEAEKGLNLL